MHAAQIAKIEAHAQQEAEENGKRAPRDTGEGVAERTAKEGSAHDHESRWRGKTSPPMDEGRGGQIQ